MVLVVTLPEHTVLLTIPTSHHDDNCRSGRTQIKEMVIMESSSITVVTSS